jgi:hypothetical protein
MILLLAIEALLLFDPDKRRASRKEEEDQSLIAVDRRLAIKQKEPGIRAGLILLNSVVAGVLCCCEMAAQFALTGRYGSMAEFQNRQLAGRDQSISFSGRDIEEGGNAVLSVNAPNQILGQFLRFRIWHGTSSVGVVPIYLPDTAE